MLADDLGFYDTAIYNPVSPTPYIRNLSLGGLRLDHHYVSVPSCFSLFLVTAENCRTSYIF